MTETEAPRNTLSNPVTGKREILEKAYFRAQSGSDQEKKLMQKAVQMTSDMEKCVTKQRHQRKVNKSVVSR